MNRRHDKAPSIAAATAAEGQDQNPSNHEGEQIVTIEAPIADPRHQTWAAEARMRIEDAVSSEECRAALAVAGVTDTDTEPIHPFEAYRYLEIHHRTTWANMLPRPAAPPWAVHTEIWLGGSGEVFITHRGPDHGEPDFAVHIELSIAVQLYPELSNDPSEPVGASAVDDPRLIWDARITADGEATATDAARFAAALAAAATELAALEG